MLTKARILQLLFMLVVLLVLFFWRTFDNSATKSVLEGQELAISTPTSIPISTPAPTSTPMSPMTAHNVVRCDYQEACEFINEQGTFLLNIKELPIQAEEWIHFELTVAHENSQISSAQIVGKSMFMGKVPVSFKQSDSYQFSGKAIVAACTHDEMVWTLEVMIDNDGEKQLLSFDFLIKK